MFFSFAFTSVQLKKIYLSLINQVTPKAGDAKFGEWPHVCAILKREKLGEVSSIQHPMPSETKLVIQDTAPLKIYQCGASLIDYGIILTAAHCVANIESVIQSLHCCHHYLCHRAADLIVRCGEWNTQNEEEKLPYQEFKQFAFD